MNSNSLGWIVVGMIGLGILLVLFFTSNKGTTNPTTDVKADTTVKVTSVPVGTFYDGQDGYSLSIPSGNNSTCIWTYEGGSADIPFSQTTYAQTASEKHTLHYYPGSNYNFKVNCTDDFGNQYVGTFPSTSGENPSPQGASTNDSNSYNF